MESTATAPAPAAAPAPEAMVTLKVNYDGTTRKCKLPLRDMGANTLEGKLRVFLDIGPSKDCLFERFSDSAGAYVELNPENTSVWKQLYRAAKAKSKLKLRVTNREPARAEQPPVEEHPLQAASTVITEAATAITAATAAITAATTITATAAASPKPATVEDEMESSTAQVIREITKPLDDLADLRYSGSGRPLDSLATATAPPPAPAPAAVATSAPVDPQPESEPAHGDVESSLLLQSPITAFAVSCNSCDQTIPNSHYHCVTCDDGDFDLCQNCIDQGITCYGPSHWLIKRSQKDGQIVCNTTETIAPKRQPRTMFGPYGIKGASSAGSDAKAEKASPGSDEAKTQDEDERHRHHHQLYRRRQRHPVVVPILSSYDSSTTLAEARINMGIRTCNNCVQDYPEHNFVHCTVCEDFDLCKSCFARDSHGHHPQHGFLRAVEGVVLPEHVAIKMRPGRNVLHNAICDGCDKFIAGVRHKCLDCPDWDYCSDCRVNAPFVHAQHRFVPIYEPLADADMVSARSVHFGICCDGPLCSSPDRSKLAGYIMGVRYKCAVCHDTDFCAACEASPSNTHNKTHPLIKFKTPVRHVSVTTHGENEEGRRMQPMGDRHVRASGFASTTSSCVNMATTVNAAADADQVATTTSSSTTEVAAASTPRIAMKSTQTVVDVKPAESAKEGAKEESKSESGKPVDNKQQVADATVEYEYPSYEATYVRETILDGSEFSPSEVFSQTWVLKNTGKTYWPVGCSVKFVGGDYMGNVNSTRPAGVVELASASESTTCYNLAPGEEFPFTVMLRAPPREGRSVSYWRLSSPAGIKFGDRLWCEILTMAPPTETVVQQQPKPESVVLPVVEPTKLAEAAAATTTTNLSNQEEADVSAKKNQDLPPQTMIFPKLEAESPRSSVHEAARAEPTPAAPIAGPTGASLAAEDDDFEDCGDLGEWDGSDDGFQTDEEYDILDASDEEYLQQQMPKRK